MDFDQRDLRNAFDDVKHAMSAIDGTQLVEKDDAFRFQSSRKANIARPRFVRRGDRTDQRSTGDLMIDE
jgi:hypothetical protein